MLPGVHQRDAKTLQLPGVCRRQRLFAVATQGPDFACLLGLRELYVDVELPQDWFDLDWGDCDDGASDDFVRVHMAGLPATLQTLEVGEIAQARSLIALNNTIGAVMRTLSRLPAGAPAVEILPMVANVPGLQHA